MSAMKFVVLVFHRSRNEWCPIRVAETADDAYAYVRREDEAESAAGCPTLEWRICPVESVAAP